MVDQRSFTILLNRGSTRATRAGTLRIADVPLMAGTPGEQDQESHGTRRDMGWVLLTGPTCR
jgi:hypothetical protein